MDGPRTQGAIRLMKTEIRQLATHQGALDLTASGPAVRICDVVAALMHLDGEQPGLGTGKFRADLRQRCPRTPLPFGCNSGRPAPSGAVSAA